MPHNISLPQHLYVHAVTDGLLREPAGQTIPAIWFGISSTPGRAIGCHVVLENGALVADLNIGQLRALPVVSPAPNICIGLERWDCFGRDIEAVEFDYLVGREARILTEDHRYYAEVGEYLFTVDWTGNGYSDDPEQHKLIHCMAVREYLCWVPTDQLVWHDPSFVVDPGEGVPAVIRQAAVVGAERLMPTVKGDPF